MPSPGRTTRWGVASLMRAPLYGLGSSGDGRDVKPHVAQAERLAGGLEDVVEEPLVQLGRQGVDLRLEDQRPHELARVLGDHLPRLQPGLRLLEAGGAQARLGLL